MKAFDGFESKPRNKGFEQLPAGAYVAKIKAAKVDGHEPDQALILRLDIAEGKWEGYYTKRYMHDTKNKNSQYPAKYKGDFRIRIPNSENKKALYPEKDIANFNDAIFRIEESNQGYHWNWDEDTLRGLLVGVSVQQGTYNGFGFTRIARLEVVSDVRNGTVQQMEPLAPRGDACEPPMDQQTGFTVVPDDGSVPF